MTTVQAIHAVFDDGTQQRRSGVPADSRRAIRVARGSDWTLEVYLTTPDGTPVELDLTGADRLLFTVRGRVGDTLFSRPAVKSSIGVGRYRVLCTSADTASAPLPRYAWDLWVLKGGRRVQTVGLSEFILTGRAAADGQPA